MKTIADYVRVNYRNRSASTGFLLSQSAGYKFNDLPFQCDISCVWFNTDDYDSRLTIYEKNVLYAFSMPSFYYEGMRLAINVRYELNKHIMVQAKYGMTHYLNRDVIGSALEAIDGSTKGDLYLQLRMNTKNIMYFCTVINRKITMSTVIYPSPIFGPVHSRRLGVSLGINLLPEDGKFCSFDCIYCECGFNKDHRPKKKLPAREQVREALEARLLDMQQNGPKPDVLTFAGNGEPTAHPEFAGIIDDTLALRDKYFPQAKVSVLSNSTFIHKAEVFKALNKIDNNILKLDTVNVDYINKVDRPTGHYDVNEIIEEMKAFKGNLIIQTMFMKGESQGKSVDNTTDEYVLPWLEAVKEIAPRQVMIYTIDRETPDHDLKKAAHEELDRIAELVKEANIPVSVSY